MKSAQMEKRRDIRTAQAELQQQQQRIALSDEHSTSSDEETMYPSYCAKARSLKSSVPHFGSAGTTAASAASVASSRNIISPEVAAALDRTNTSNRKATFIIAATAQALGCSASQCAISPNTIRNARLEHRSAAGAAIKQQVAASASTGPLVVHRDSKLLPSGTGREKAERLAVLVSGDGIRLDDEAPSQLLAVPIIPAATGEAQAAAIK